MRAGLSREGLRTHIRNLFLQATAASAGGGPGSGDGEPAGNCPWVGGVRKVVLTQNPQGPNSWDSCSAEKPKPTGRLASVSSFACSTQSVHLEGLSGKENLAGCAAKAGQREPRSLDNIQSFELRVTEPTERKGQMAQLRLSGKTRRKGPLTLAGGGSPHRNSQDFKKTQRCHQQQ